MRRFGVRVWLTACYGLMLGVILLAFGLIVYLMMRHNLHARLELELDGELAELRQEVELAHDRIDLQRQLKLRFLHHTRYEYEVSDSLGKSVFLSERLQQTRLRTGPVRLPYEPHSGQMSVSEDSRRATSGVLKSRSSSTQDAVTFSRRHLSGLGDYLIAGQVFSSPQEPLLINIATPLSESQADLRELLFVLMTAGPVFMIAALACGYWLARTALAPVANITATAEQITAQHLDRRLDVAAVDDELSQLAQTLNRMMDRLQHSFDETKRFAADAAHELRTPLTIIRNEVEVTLRAARAPIEYELTLHSVLEETVQLSQLTDRLLLLCRADSDLGTHGRIPMSLEQSLSEAVEGLSSIARSKQISIDLDLNEAAMVNGDPVQLRQLWTNLLDNSLKHTPDHGRISVAVSLDDNQAVIEIRDTGHGILPEHLPHVFERFYRVDSSRRRVSGGAGLGLAICQAIVQAHQGEIQIQSSSAAGTVVVVHLPYSRET